MGQNPDHFPKTGVGSHQQERIIRDISMFNYHINSHKMHFLKDFVDIIDAHRLNLDFDGVFDPDHWTITTIEAGTGAATEACANTVNGILRVTNDNADNDYDELVYGCEAWKLVSNYPLYAEIRLRISDAKESDFWFGLILGSSWFASTPADAVIFLKDDGDNNLNFLTRTNAAQTKTDTGADLANATWIRLGFHWDGVDTVRYFVIQDGNAPQTILAAGEHNTHICQDEELAVGFGLRNGEAVAKYVEVDYIKVVQLRVIE